MFISTPCHTADASEVRMFRYRARPSKNWPHSHAAIILIDQKNNLEITAIYLVSIPANGIEF